MRTGLRPLLTLIFLSAASLISSAAAPGSIIVSGRIAGIAEDGRRSLIINECDYSEKSARVFVELDSAGSFNVKVPFSSGHTFTIVYDKTFINAYAEPGDSLRIDIDASVSPFTFTMSGDHGKLNDELAHAHEALYKLYYGIKLPSPETPLTEYLPAFKSVVNDKQSAVDAYIAANGVSAETAEMLRIDNLFIIANSACDYTGANKEEEYAFFTDSIFDVFNEKNARLMIFPYHLSALCRKFPEIIDQTPKGKIRDLLYVALAGDTVPQRDDFSEPAYFDRVFGKGQVKIDLSRVNQAICWFIATALLNRSTESKLSNGLGKHIPANRSISTSARHGADHAGLLSQTARMSELISRIKTWLWQFYGLNQTKKVGRSLCQR